MLLKEPIERVLCAPSIGRLTRRRVRGKRLILAYHGVVPEGARPDGEHTLFIAQRDFAAHLDMLSTVADVGARSSRLLIAADSLGERRQSAVQ